MKVGTLGHICGERIDDFFDPARINVVNAAGCCRCSRTFLTEGLGPGPDPSKCGDVATTQFGHNDGSQLFPAIARALDQRDR